MYPKGELSRVKKEFWTSFGRYISPVLSAGEERINWINYHTGVRHFYFRMDFEKTHASIAIEITHPDPGIRNNLYQRVEMTRGILEEHLEERWTWDPVQTDEHGKVLSRIYKDINGVNILDRNTWPETISFLKPRILALDRYWSDVKHLFDDLR